jgi:hypothetical protein
MFLLGVYTLVDRELGPSQRYLKALLLKHTHHQASPSPIHIHEAGHNPEFTSPIVWINQVVMQLLDPYARNLPSLHQSTLSTVEPWSISTHATVVVVTINHQSWNSLLLLPIYCMLMGVRGIREKTSSAGPNTRCSSRRTFVLTYCVINCFSSTSSLRNFSFQIHVNISNTWTERWLKLKSNARTIFLSSFYHLKIDVIF